MEKTRRKSMVEKTLHDLFHETLKDIYHAERQILRKMPKMVKSVNSKELAQAFQNHQKETEMQIERLEQVFESIGKRPQGKSCEAMKAILEESEEVIEDFAGSDALDAGILGSAQAVEHYEITRYGTLKAWAKQLGLNDAVKLLDASLKEEEKTDMLLSKIAEQSINAKAAHQAAAK
jgi:ferritin-like metal-binding protein YciE